MKTIDDLIERATELAERGYAKGEIADELNISRETASWLVENTGIDPPTERRQTPQDIHVDWANIGQNSTRLYHAGASMANLVAKHDDGVTLTVGIEKAGVPLATTVARELDTDLSTYTPRKHQWEEGDIEELSGSFSRNFADIRGRSCYLVDDTITSGTTMTETINAVREVDGSPVACMVLVDKKGIEEIEGVPVYSLIQVIRVDGEGTANG